MPVQLVSRPSHDFRGYAGQIASGSIHPGDPITVWPSGLTTTVSRIVTWDGDLDVAFAPMSVTLVLADEIDISRGDVLAQGHVELGTTFCADMVWMDERPLDTDRVYLIKHATRVVTAEVDRRLTLNEIGRVIITASRPLVFERYRDDRTMGSFVMIDPATNFTAGAGMIASRVREQDSATSRQSVSGRIARAARGASSESDAVENVRRILEEILA